MLAAEVSRTTFAVRLGDNVSLPCLDSITDVDQITWRRPGKHRNHLISDSGKFIVPMCQLQMRVCTSVSSTVQLL